MRALFLILLTGLTCLTGRTQPWWMPPTAAATSKVSFSDNFDRTDAASLGANWSDSGGVFGITNNHAINMLATVNSVALYTAQPCHTLSQYAKATLTELVSEIWYGGLVFRGSTPGEDSYTIKFGNDGTVVWFQNVSGVETGVQSASITVNSGDSFGVVVAGTGTDTVVTIWRNPTGNAPTSSILWGGASPDVTFTNNPGTPQDSGYYLGMMSYCVLATVMHMDDFYGGDLP